MSKTTKIVLALAVSFILILAVYAICTPEKKNASKIGEKDFMTQKKDPTTVPLGETGFETVGEDAADQLEYYKKWSQYPPYSRPLYSGQVDLLDPYNLVQAPVSVVATPASGCKPDQSGNIRCEKQATFAKEQCKFTTESSISVGKKDFKVLLACNDQSGQNVPITKIVPKVYTILFHDKIPSLPVVHFGDDGTNGDEVKGDNIYTFIVRPTTTDWGDMFLEADMEVNGRRHNQRVSWYSTPSVVAEFKTGIRDQVKDGSLVITVPVNIKQKGFYHFDANLQAEGEDKTLVATSSWEGDLNTGDQRVEFQFFGKIIKDVNAEGPYLVRNIRGKRNNSSVTPSMVAKAMEENREISGNQKEPLWQYIEPAPDFKTRQYNLSEFSGDEWSSKEKEERLQFLRNEANKK